MSNISLSVARNCKKSQLSIAKQLATIDKSRNIANIQSVIHNFFLLE
jgi:hypothetical protein